MSLQATAKALVEPGKGILAADESHPTMEKRLARVGLASTERVRRDYREVLMTAPGLSDHISGVILFDETIRQSRSSGTPFAQGLLRAGIIPGIKVDAGTTPLPRFPTEVVTQGLDGLVARLTEYAALGARFAKWRAVIRIADGRPTAGCVEANAHALARYPARAGVLVAPVFGGLSTAFAALARNPAGTLPALFGARLRLRRGRRAGPRTAVCGAAYWMRPFFSA